MKTRHWKLDELGEPVPCEDLMEWSAWFEDSGDKRVVAQTQVRDCMVSTVFLGLDHSFSPDAPPVLFETMIFGGPLDGEQTRYSTRAAAHRGHAEHVERARRAKPFDLGRNIVHMHGYRLVRRYRGARKQWAVFHESSRAAIACVIRTSVADRHWQLLARVRGVEDHAGKYLSECICALDRRLVRLRAEEIIRGRLQ